MTTTTSTFTPSTQILEAGEQAQALADAGKALKPFLPEEAQQTIEGVEKVANALNATGQALKHFGFDEAEPELVTSASDVELIPTDEPVITDHMNVTPSDLIPDNLRPSTGVIAAGQVLQEIGFKGPGAAVEGAGQIMRSFGFDEADEDDVVGTKPSDIVKGVGVGISTVGAGITTWSAASTPVTTIGGVAGTVVGAGTVVVGGVTAFTGFVLGWAGLDVDESEDLGGGFHSNPELLSPLNAGSGAAFNTEPAEASTAVVNAVFGGGTNGQPLDPTTGVEAFA